MALILLLFAALITLSKRAHSETFFEKCENLLERWGIVRDDPYQWEEYPDSYLAAQVRALKIKRDWSKATENELRRLKDMEAVLQQREPGWGESNK